MANNRNIGLDYLRVVSIVIVLANHLFLEFFVGTSKIVFGGFNAAASVSAVIAIEWLFVLSGFLIGTMMIRSFQSDRSWHQCARDFWLRRWFRTIPNYFLFVGVNLILVWFGYTNSVFEFKYLWFSQNLAWVETTPHFFGESWSLALDEWFYLLMPMLLGLFGVVFPNNRKRCFILAALFLIVAPTVNRFLSDVPTNFFSWDAEVRRITVFHLDATGWGVLAAAINRWYLEWWEKYVRLKAIFGLLCMAVGLFFVVSLVHPRFMNPFLFAFGNVFSITMMAGGTFLFLPWLTQFAHKYFVSNFFVEKISLYSYSIYLIHYPLLLIFKKHIIITEATSFWGMFALSAFWLVSVMVLSALVYYYFEKPTSDLREVFTKRVDASPFSRREHGMS
jgi:peptidoglycan/LPS O-acetylase OafA/YrhL